MSQQDDMDTVIKAMAKYDGTHIDGTDDMDGGRICGFCYVFDSHQKTCPVLLARRLAEERRPGACPICERPNCEWHGCLDAKWKAALSD